MSRGMRRTLSKGRNGEVELMPGSASNNSFAAKGSLNILSRGG